MEFLASAVSAFPLLKEEREQKLVKYSFSSDLQVIHEELDEIAGTTAMDAYLKVFLTSKCD